MSETKLPQELEEQAALYALGLLAPDDRRAFETRLKLGAGQLQAASSAYHTVVGELGLSAPPVQPRASLKERVLAHVAQQAETQPGPLSAFTFVRAAELEWLEVSPGTFVKVLFNDEAHHRSTVLCRMDPGSVYAPHRHAQTEELYVLKGSCHCGGRLMYAGDYHRAESGSVHPPTWTETGSLMLVISSTQNEPLP